MHPNLISNMKKSIQYMTDEKFRDRTYRNFLDEINAADTCPFESRFISDAVFPCFYFDKDKTLSSPQKDFFSFYALRNIVRGCLVSCRFIEGGNLLDDSGFYALSTISYYSAAFQILITFLALHGNVVISSPIEALLDNQILPTQIIAKLNSENTWTFEGVDQSHKALWRCLSQVLNERYKDGFPTFFNEFLKYVAVLNGLSFDLNDKQLTQQVVMSIPDLRHKALYTGFGFDKIEFANALKQPSNEFKIDALSKSLKCFTLDFLSYCLKDILPIKAKIEKMQSFFTVYYILRAGIWLPPFETTKDLNLKVDDIEKDIKTLQKWLHL